MLKLSVFHRILLPIKKWFLLTLIVVVPLNAQQNASPAGAAWAGAVQGTRPIRGRSEGDGVYPSRYPK